MIEVPHIYLGQPRAESFYGRHNRKISQKDISEATGPVLTFATQNYLRPFYITGIQLA